MCTFVHDGPRPGRCSRRFVHEVSRRSRLTTRRPIPSALRPITSIPINRLLVIAQSTRGIVHEPRASKIERPLIKIASYNRFRYARRDKSDVPCTSMIPRGFSFSLSPSFPVEDTTLSYTRAINTLFVLLRRILSRCIREHLSEGADRTIPRPSRLGNNRSLEYLDLSRTKEEARASRKSRGFAF